MNKSMKMIALFGLLALLGASGCVPPQILVAQGFAGQRVVRYTIQQNGQSSESDQNLFNLSARICDQGDDGTDNNCQDSLILENVKPQSIY